MAGKIGYMPFPEFFSTGNNSKYCSILGLFSVLGAPRKVIDTVLESSTHGGEKRLYAVTRNLSRGNNYKYCTILGLFSVLWAPRKVIDTVLESSTHGDQS